MTYQYFKYQREEAKVWGVRRDQLFHHSKKAYERGDREKSKAYSDLRKYCQRRMEELNVSAANAIFIHNNQHQPMNIIDLHGLYVSEAEGKLIERALDAIKESVDYLTVIVGQGHHSEDGPKIKPAVRAFARKNGIPYEFNTPNPGRIRLDLRQFGSSPKYNDNISIDSSTLYSTERVHQGSTSENFNEILQNTYDIQPQASGSLWKILCCGAVFVGALKLLGWF